MILLVILAGCSFGDEPSVCPFNTRLEYWYAASNTENSLPVFVDNLRQYLYDSRGKLLATTTLKGDSISGWTAELPAGKYTVVVWGNLGDEGKSSVEVLTDSDGAASGMSLSAARDGVPPGFRENTERLYYGTASFEVNDGMTLRKRVYLSHAHAVLSVTVQWMIDPPEADGTYRMRLKGIPSTYNFLGGEEVIAPFGDETFSIPRIGGSVTYHETRAAMNFDEEVTGQFVTFRYTADTHQMWSLWRNGEQIIKDLDLNSFFRKLPMDMDTNMEQEFDILVTVYEDKIIVTLASQSDWEEGGTIG